MMGMVIGGVIIGVGIMILALVVYSVVRDIE